MKQWLPAAGLLLAAVAGTYALLHTGAGRSLVARIAEWEDTRHGLGDPCTDRSMSEHPGPYGVTFNLPRCWTVAPSNEGGVPVETILDPGLRRSFAIRYIRRDEPEIWARAMDAFNRRLASPMANISEVRGWRIVSAASQRPGSKQPNTYFEWAMTNGEVVVLVAFEIHKFYVQSPKVIAFVQSIDGVMHTIRTTAPAESAAR